MIDWDDCTPLTRDEFGTFIGAAVPFLKRMEDKNGWDFFVNDDSIGWFCHRFLIEAFKLNEYKDYQRYNIKVRDTNALCCILIGADWTKENETLRKDKGSEIWKLVLNKVNDIADAVL